MTAERFELCEINCFDYGIQAFNEIMDNGVPLSQKQVCELLNEQHETIHRFKQNIDELLCVNVEEELLKENEQLKQSFKEVLKDLEVTTFDKELLEKENEQLKKENNKLADALTVYFENKTKKGL